MNYLATKTKGLKAVRGILTAFKRELVFIIRTSFGDENVL